MVLTVVYLGDHSKLKALEAYDADFSAADYSGRTALHVAASTGQAGLGLTPESSNIHIDFKPKVGQFS
jgi:hypothetical protein